MALVEAGRFYNVIEGSMARARLAADGIESVLFDTEMNWGGLDGVVPIRLMVDEDDEREARRLLSDDA
ncbi:MAG: DUF2007 domain-containing protein [Alphaproteobacteria bacterium]|nr:MAG: DUF2007 domain-containing protein [Alphaproteobacteria bacterium]